MENTKPSSARYLGYVRVSSNDQARGTSLIEQRSYIERYAVQKAYGLEDIYEESESAAKTGRGKFDEMIRRLKEEKLRGLIFHKVDRSARNPRDQALLWDLIQEGYEMHFVAEGISTVDPVGRHMMYMLWALASGYSENLRAEILKGQHGRLKQGKLPWHLPLGYERGMDCTAVPDKKRAPLIRMLFQEYAAGLHSIRTLTQRAKEVGLVNKVGANLGKNAIEAMLKQTFYYGVITHSKTGAYKGEHEPIVSKSTFERVQYFLKKRGFKRKYSHAYVFGNLVACPNCGSMLKAMTSTKRHKNRHKWKYYYCRNKECFVTSFKESDLEQQAIAELKKIELGKDEVEAFAQAVREHRVRAEGDKLKQLQAVDLNLKNVQSRLDGLFGLLADDKIDAETHKKMRLVLINKQLELQETKRDIEQGELKRVEQLETLGKLLKSPSIAFRMANTINRRRLVTAMVENCHLTQKGLVFIWKKPFDVIAKRSIPETSGDGGN